MASKKYLWVTKTGDSQAKSLLQQRMAEIQDLKKKVLNKEKKRLLVLEESAMYSHARKHKIPWKEINPLAKARGIKTMDEALADYTISPKKLLVKNPQLAHPSMPNALEKRREHIERIEEKLVELSEKWRRIPQETRSEQLAIIAEKLSHPQGENEQRTLNELIKKIRFLKAANEALVWKVRLVREAIESGEITKE